MFEFIGEKIKMIAKVMLWIGILAAIAGVIVFLALLEEPDCLLIGLPIFGGGIVLSVNSFFVYAFGELVDNSGYLPGISYTLKKGLPQETQQPSAPQETQQPSAPQAAPNAGWTCKKCGSANTANTTVCTKCWEARS